MLLFVVFVGNSFFDYVYYFVERNERLPGWVGLKKNYYDDDDDVGPAPADVAA